MAGIDGTGQAVAGITSSTMSSSLMQFLLADDIVPGSPPSYEIAKTIYSYHPLGAKMAESPIGLAQSLKREITIPGGPEDDLIRAFRKEWSAIGRIGGDKIIHNVMKQSRIYGIAALILGAQGIPANEPIPLDRIHELDLYFNVLDPLNTAGSLVLDQDPNAPDYQKPTYLSVGSVNYHPSRSVIMLNEQPIYIEWTNSAFGFVGRSVYQRALYPLKSFVQSMITDNAIMEKSGLLVMKLKSPGSVIDQRARTFFGFKRQALQGSKTGNVLSIGIDENVESLDLKNLKDATEFARNNILKNIATAANMPASMLNQETLAEGFGEGTEDAKQIARYIDGVRTEMEPAYAFMDQIVQRRAWSTTFYATIQNKYRGDYGKMPYETAFARWRNAFTATWPNLLTEPDSEKAKVDDTIMKAAIGCVEVLAPLADPENKARIACWLADVMNDRKLIFSAPLILDEEALANYTPPTPAREPQAMPEGYES